MLNLVDRQKEEQVMQGGERRMTRGISFWVGLFQAAGQTGCCSRELVSARRHKTWRGGGATDERELSGHHGGGREE